MTEWAVAEIDPFVLDNWRAVQERGTLPWTYNSPLWQADIIGTGGWEP